MRGLTVLITNNTLDNRAGSELYVRDIAAGLLKRGHTPVAFSTVLGDVARELRKATIPVIDNLDALATPPDIIHGQHHVETMMALLRFPDTPAVYFCHGWLPWEEAPPHFPRIMSYVAVDDTCRDRLVLENAIPEDRIRVLLNFVDLERFKPRGPLPTRPKRALIFRNDVNELTHVRVVREACGRADIALDVIGLNSGNTCNEPEAVLGKYDIVFAKGRSALEAMAVGAAVVLYDVTAAGPMVTTCELDRLRRLNFGIRAAQEPISLAVLEREIARYDANDADQVSQRIRAVAGRDTVVDDILSLYEEARGEFGRMDRDMVAEQRAAYTYLRWLSPRLKENDRLKGERDWIQSEHERLSSRFAAREQEVQAVQARLTRQFAESEQKAIEFEHQAREREQKADALARELADKESLLASITNTLGWRLLSHFGPTKYSFVLPAYRRLQKLLSRGER